MSILLRFLSVLIFCMSLNASGISQANSCPEAVALKHFSRSFDTDFPPVGVFLRGIHRPHSVVLHGSEVRSLDANGLTVWEAENFFNDPGCTENTCRLHEMNYQGNPLVMVSQIETERFALLNAETGASLFTGTFGRSQGKSLKLVDLKTNNTDVLLLSANPAETEFELRLSSPSLLSDKPVPFFSCTERPIFGFTTFSQTLFAFPSNLTKPNSVKKVLFNNVFVFEPHQFEHIIKAGETRLIDAFVIDPENVWVAAEGKDGTSIWKLGENKARYSAGGRHEVKFQAEFSAGLPQSIQNLKGLQVALVNEGHIAVHDLVNEQTPLSFYSIGVKARNPQITDDGKLLITEVMSGPNRQVWVYKLDTSELISAFPLGRGSILDLRTVDHLPGRPQPPVYSLLVSTPEGVTNWYIRPHLAK